jgi:hypothetical protein
MFVRFTALLMLAPTLLSGQDHDHGQAPRIEKGGVFPPGWSVRPDDGGKLTEVSLVAMPPGWHVTTAASGIMYRAQDRAGGRYEVSAKIHLFPGPGGHREAFGLFIGGRDLEGAGQRYTYFLIRGDGTYKVKRRSAASATDVTREWTAAPSIVKQKPDGPVANVVSVVVGKDGVSFRVNGQQVYLAPAREIDTEGIVGLRVNHNLSLHIENLAIKPAS